LVRDFRLEQLHRVQNRSSYLKRLCRSSAAVLGAAWMASACAKGDSLDASQVPSVDAGAELPAQDGSVAAGGDMGSSGGAPGGASGDGGGSAMGGTAGAGATASGGAAGAGIGGASGKGNSGASGTSGNGGAKGSGGASSDGGASNDGGPRGFGYVTSNFDASTTSFANAPSVTLGCGMVTIDTSATGAVDLCGTSVTPATVNLSGGATAMLIELHRLDIAGGTTVNVTGSRPLILAVDGDVTISGTIDAGAKGATPGPNGNSSCQGATGTDGQDNPGVDDGAGAGGGGAFGTPGGVGGDGDNPGRDGKGGAFGAPIGTQDLVPLRGGCPGGKGGKGWTASDNTRVTGGAGGGAIQISASGLLKVNGGGAIAAAGGVGTLGGSGEDGGAGGGSGGGILLEADDLQIVAGGWVTANGGGGGAGQASQYGFDRNTQAGGVGSDGAKTSSLPALGGKGVEGGGDGGAGAAGTTAASAGSAGQSGGGVQRGSGGGGGGGGAGRIRLHAKTCSVPQPTSPPATQSCG
jgi:hypothetical protein